MAKATEQKNKPTGKPSVSRDTKTVRNDSLKRANAAEKKKKMSASKKGGEAVKDKGREGKNGTSENWNVIMPFLLGAVTLLLVLLYVFVFIDKQKDGAADAGAVGDWLYNVLMWLLGPTAYLIPAGLAVVAVRWRGVSRKKGNHVVLWVQLVSVLVLSSVIAELLFGVLLKAPIGGAIVQKEAWIAYGSALKIFDPAEATLAGGFLGGFFALVMYWALRKIISAILLIVLEICLLMFFVGLTPERILAFMKAHHERRLEKSAASLSEFEEARKAEAEAAKAERAAAAALKEEEKRLQKEEEAIRRIREREEKRRAEEDAERKRESENKETEKPEEADPLSSVPDSSDVPTDTVTGNTTVFEENEAVEYEPLVEHGGLEEDDREIVDTPVLATDLDFGLDENSAKHPRTALPGDEELFGSFGDGGVRVTPDTAECDDAESEDEEKPSEGVSSALTEELLSEEPEYIYPSTELLMEGKPSHDISEFKDEIEGKREELASVLTSFGVRFRSIEFSRGPTITRYEIQPEPGQRVKAIQNLMDDIALSMAVSGVRFEPSIPGKAAVGIEVPNKMRETVTLRSLVESDIFTSEKSKLTACLGADITGKPVVFDISKMPHLLVAGATGMGKSVCINSIIVSLMYKATPEEVRLILVDPKKVEFAMYRDMPHLLTPIITDPQKAAGALCSAVSEMEKRFELIERVGARDIAGYKKVTAGDPDMPKMCHIVIIIDELADLMMTASNDVEAAIMRIAQKARAAGIHLIIGTQRPSVDVITGTIKANIPSRIACTVASQTDSRTILDSQGAEKLCGRGDMLFAPVGASRPRRVQGSFVSEDEVVRVVNFMINNNGTAVYDEQFMENINIEAERCAKSKKASSEAAMVAECEEDPKLNEAIELAIECGKIATSLLQRRIGVGYGRAAKIIDRMEQLGVVSAADGNKPRQVLITMEEYLARFNNSDEEGVEE